MSQNPDFDGQLVHEDIFTTNSALDLILQGINLDYRGLEALSRETVLDIMEEHGIEILPIIFSPEEFELTFDEDELPLADDCLPSPFFIACTAAEALVVLDDEIEFLQGYRTELIAKVAAS